LFSDYSSVNSKLSRVKKMFNNQENNICITLVRFFVKNIMEGQESKSFNEFQLKKEIFLVDFLPYYNSYLFMLNSDLHLIQDNFLVCKILFTDKFKI